MRRQKGLDFPASNCLIQIISSCRRSAAIAKRCSCDLILKSLIVARYYAKELGALDRLGAELESVTAKLAELEEEHGGEEGAFAKLDKVNKANVAARLKEMKSMEGQMSREAGMPGATKGGPDNDDEAAVLNEWLKRNTEEADLKKKLKEAEAALDAKAYTHYPKLTEAEIKTLVVDDKWLGALDRDIHGEMDRISQALTQRVKDLAERYEIPLPQLTSRVAELEAKVNHHLERMGFAWK